jgi:hypothetical protein
MDARVVFHLAKYVGKPQPETLYEQIKNGTKRSEWREANLYWFTRLCGPDFCPGGLPGWFPDGSCPSGKNKPLNISSALAVNTAWFVQGYPKGTLPRLEALIFQLFFHSSTRQLEITFGLVRERFI